jgi:hypothetical protein
MSLHPPFERLDRRPGDLDDYFAGKWGFWILTWGRRLWFDFGNMLPLMRRWWSLARAPECRRRLKIHKIWNTEKILRGELPRVLSKEFQIDKVLVTQAPHEAESVRI